VLAIVWRGAVAAALWYFLIATGNAAPLSAVEVRQAMTRVEALIAGLGIEVAGYARTTEPLAEYVPSDHPYLQGNEGGYVDGRIYISDQANTDCVALTLVHELVHDATAKLGLFATVSNNRIRDAFEAFADVITETAAQDPYLPGCLPRRHIDLDEIELVALAAPQHARAVPPMTPSPIETTIPQAEMQSYGLAMWRCRSLFGDTCIALPPPL